MAKPSTNGNGTPRKRTQGVNRVKSLFGGGYGGFGSGMDQSYNTLWRALSGIQLPPIIRAQDPFDNHPWIFSAAVTTATVASQAPFTVFRETDEAEERRMRFYEKHYNRTWRPSRGKARRAIQRYSRINPLKRMIQRALEADFDHPLVELFENPNPYQKGNQLFWLTTLWLTLRGHVFWVLQGDSEDGTLAPGAEPTSIWPMSPDLFEPILEHGSWGLLVGWRFCVPNYMALQGPSEQVILSLDQVIEFKQAHPRNLLQGVSRMAVTAYDVTQDLNLKEYNRSIVENDGDPGGVVMYDSQMTETERQDWLEKWAQRHEGTDKKRKTALLDAGFKYMPIAMSPIELQGQEQLEWNRAEELAVMGTPPSVLGVTEFVNYATDLGQKRNFWDHTIIPLLKLQEETIDGSPFFFEQSDSVVGLFDLKDVEALRAGMVEKIEVAKEMCGTELHAPPKVAYEAVGLDIEEYEGDDFALITPTLTTVEKLIEGLDAPPEEPVPTETPAGDVNVDEPEEPVVEPVAAASLKAVGSKRWQEFAAMEQPWEMTYGLRYQRWVSSQRTQVLRDFDDAVRARLEELETKGWNPVVKVDPSVDLTAILPNLQQSQNELRVRIRPLYPQMLNATFQFTLQDIGIPVFSIDAPSILAVMEAREDHLVLNTPRTVRNQLIKSLSVGIEQGESILSLRQRVAEVYGIAGSDAKALQIARTETAGFMNAERNVMFQEQGITKLKWSTAGDENVRDDHKTFGAADPQAIDFNYLELVGGIGTLTAPGDARAPANQVINCRCIQVIP